MNMSNNCDPQLTPGTALTGIHLIDTAVVECLEHERASFLYVFMKLFSF